jgi:hypothetical protein
MTTTFDDIKLTSRVAVRGQGVKRHYLRDEDHTNCGVEIDGNWQVGDPRPPTSTSRDYWCARCFPNRFTLLAGVTVELDD